jgi:class 3 adenylate cyclase
MAFTGHVPPVILEKMMAAPTQHHSLETQERIITVVFIDLVGFSIFSSNMPPKMAFEHLKKVMQFITGLIHTHGGVVDRTLGDGLLCYFGHTFNKQATELNSGHADRAVQCCLQIQEQNIRQLVQGKDVNIVFPIRIGINTASCYIGNMGSSDRIDFTIVGNGVNFAKRLESCCTMNHILISESTYRYLHDLRLPKDAVAKRSIRIKHHDQEIQTFEINPVSDNPALLEYASRNFERLTKAELIIESWHVLDSRGIRVLVASKTAEITLLTKTYLHLKTFAAHSDGTIMLKIEDSKPSAPDRQLDGIQLSGTLQFLTDNPDKSRTYQFTPAPEAAPQMQQFSALFLKRAVVDSVTNSRHKGKLILFGARS